MWLKSLFLVSLLGPKLNQIEASATEQEHNLVGTPTLSPLASSQQEQESFDYSAEPLPESIIPTLTPTCASYTFPPMQTIKRYMLVTPRGIDQAENLTSAEQAVIVLNNLAISSELNFVYVEADDVIANKLIGNKFTNKRLQLLTEASANNQKFCPVKIFGYIVMAIGALQNNAIIKTATGVGVSNGPGIPHMYPLDDTLAVVKNMPVKLYEITNPGFFGSEILVYSYNGKIGSFTPQSALGSFDVVYAFAEVLKLATIRKPMKVCIVYTGDRTDDLVAQLIDEVNKTTPVFPKLDDALDYIRKDFFRARRPHLTLDDTGCPIGQQSKKEKIKLVPFLCTEEFPIYGITNSSKDYGMTFTVTYTNRRFSLKVSTLRNNGTVAEFNITFRKDGLLVQAEQGSNDIVSPIELDLEENNSASPVTMMFGYNGFVNSKEYDIKFKAEECKFGVGSNTAHIDVRKKGDLYFNQLGIFNIHGQPRFTRFCGFSPSNNADTSGMRTEIVNIKSRYLNSGLRNVKN